MGVCLSTSAHKICFNIFKTYNYLIAGEKRLHRTGLVEVKGGNMVMGGLKGLKVAVVG